MTLIEQIKRDREAGTPGPWWPGRLDHAEQREVRAEHIEIATCWHHGVTSIEVQMEANARRIVACVNACVGMSTKWLEEREGTYSLMEMVGWDFADMKEEPDGKPAPPSDGVPIKKGN